MTDLISTTVGGRVVAFNDEFFAEAENLLKTTEPEWKEGLYTDRGKWMDGWETRRRRDEGHDWCIIALGIPGRIRSVIVDTSYFTGNFAEAFSLEGCGVGIDDRLDDAEWVDLIPRSQLQGDSTAGFEVGDLHRVTHLRLNIFPDGGVARLRVDGDPIPSKDDVCPDGDLVDLASSILGGEALDASDVHYSSPSNLLRPTDPAGMWDGWETKRRRGPGHDWATFRLGLPGMIELVEVDTRHFKGNSPGWVSVHLSSDGETWDEAVTRAPVVSHSINVVRLPEPAAASHVRLDLHPDGGVARLRVRGTPERAAAVSRRLDFVNSLFDSEARRFFTTACASSTWVESMLEERPFADDGAVLSGASEGFDQLVESDWLEAFAGHPRIGERGDAMTNTEQSGARGAPVSVLDDLARVNSEYETRHGFTYIVYATGKGADEMLEIASNRLGNSREEEIANAAVEQRAITETRLRRMLCMGAR